jgi:hypothetical protein
VVIKVSFPAYRINEDSGCIDIRVISKVMVLIKFLPGILVSHGYRRGVSSSHYILGLLALFYYSKEGF